MADPFQFDALPWHLILWVRYWDPVAVGEFPHFDRTPSPGPLDPPFKSPKLIIPHAGAYGKLSDSPAGSRPGRALLSSSLAPAF
jgi:hypothetical protein